MEFSHLTNHFLVAMPALLDPYFHHTVTYICMHNKEGAMGITINRPLDIHLGDILHQLDIDAKTPEISQIQLYHGGPVNTGSGFVLHQPAEAWDSSVSIHDDISMTTSRDILEFIADGKGPVNSLIALGYAAWEPGQLEQEIKDNIWLSAPAKIQIMFDAPADKRWLLATQCIGVNHLSDLSPEAGHA